MPPCAPRATRSNRSFSRTITRTLHYDYLAYVPEDYATSPDKKYPFILFLHGVGERGSDVQKLKAQGLPKYLAQGHELPFIVVSPQCPEKGSWDPDDLNLFLDDVLPKYRVDPDRIYLTGLSMGGYGTWELASRFPDRFAAIVPICGGAALTGRIRNLKLPIWAFHGAHDDTVPMEESVRLISAIRAAGNKSARLTIYPDSTHDSWTQTYNNPALYT